MPYTIVFFCGICDMPYLSYSSTGVVVDTRMPGTGDANRSPESPHLKPVGFNLSTKAK
jgi:hypothetical protein